MGVCCFLSCPHAKPHKFIKHICYTSRQCGFYNGGIVDPDTGEWLYIKTYKFMCRPVNKL